MIILFYNVKKINYLHNFFCNNTNFPRDQEEEFTTKTIPAFFLINDYDTHNSGVWRRENLMKLSVQRISYSQI